MAQQRVITPAAEFLAEAGKFLHGREGWMKPLAGDLGIKTTMLSNWLNGKSQLRWSHPVVREALDLVVDRLREQEERWRERFAALADAPAEKAPGGPGSIAKRARGR